jgi:GT2 family glycosyltransferase
VTQNPEISVVVPTYRRPDLLPRCLAALRAQDAADRCQVIVVDDASGDATGAVLDAAVAGWPKLIRITQPVNRGPAAARNVGIAAATGPLILFIDDDIVAPPTLVSQHLARHATADPLRGVVGKVDWHPDVPVNSFMAWLDTTELQFRFATMREGPVAKPWEAFYTCNLSVPRHLLQDAGGFDERFPYPAFEDTDLGIRLTERGFHLDYRPSVLAWHYRSVSLEEFCRRTRQVGESAVLLTDAQPDLPFDLPTSDVESTGLRGFAIRSLPTVARLLPLRRIRAMSYLAQVNRAYRDGVRAGKARTQNRK